MRHSIENLLILFLLVGCTSTKVVSFYVEDEGRVQFKTFSFYKRDIRNLKLEQAELDSLIENTILKGLQAKGYTYSYPSEAYVSFQITTGNTSSSQINNPYYYRRTYYPYYNYNVDVTQYKEGVFLVEIYNQNEKLIWQGSKTFKVRNTKDTKQLLLQYASEIIEAFKTRL